MNKELKTYIGIDIGASKMAAVLWDGEIRDRKIERYLTTDTFNSWKKWVLGFLSDFKADKVGIAVAGITNGTTVVKSPNLPILDNKDLKREFSKAGSVTVVQNDAQCFIVAEHRCGAARGMSDVLGVTIGTGVGGALIINGELETGEHGSAGEVGHLVIDGSKTLEDLVSSKVLAGQDGMELASRARAGDENARQVFDRMGMYLGRGLANLVNTLDPEAIIIGGGLANTLDLMRPQMEKEMLSLIVSPQAKKIPVIESHFKEYAPAVGAAILANF